MAMTGISKQNSVKSVIREKMKFTFLSGTIWSSEVASKERNLSRGPLISDMYDEDRKGFNTRVDSKEPK